MKKIDSEFFIVYSIEPIEFYNSAVGINELAKIFNRTRSSMIRSLKSEYIRFNNRRYFILRETDLK